MIEIIAVSAAATFSGAVMLIVRQYAPGGATANADKQQIRQAFAAARPAIEAARLDPDSDSEFGAYLSFPPPRGRVLARYRRAQAQKLGTARTPIPLPPTTS
ncbi:hypothetical protein [Nonomuraea dietziae]|uniref:hypothetical protein n=1 Tax=Nonomuraea dietziae TaxID=65515 RepID=UPI0033C1EE82